MHKMFYTTKFERWASPQNIIFMQKLRYSRSKVIHFLYSIDVRLGFFVCLNFCVAGNVILIGNEVKDDETCLQKYIRRVRYNKINCGRQEIHTGDEYNVWLCTSSYAIIPDPRTLFPWRSVHPHEAPRHERETDNEYMFV